MTCNIIYKLGQFELIASGTSSFRFSYYTIPLWAGSVNVFATNILSIIIVVTTLNIVGKYHFYIEATLIYSDDCLSSVWTWSEGNLLKNYKNLETWAKNSG